MTNTSYGRVQRAGAEGIAPQLAATPNPTPVRGGDGVEDPAHSTENGQVVAADHVVRSTN